MRSVRKLCRPTLSNETWHLACSKEGARDINRGRGGGDKGMEGKVTQKGRNNGGQQCILFDYAVEIQFAPLRSFHNHLCSTFLTLSDATFYNFFPMKRIV